MELIVLSDATGNLGEYFVRDVISQFPKQIFELKVFSFVDGVGGLSKVFGQLEGKQPILFHAILGDKEKKFIREHAIKKGWHEYDLMGPAIKFLEKASHQKACLNLKALHELNRDYDQRISAINFTVEHDDGLSKRTLEQADIVLMGVSRTSKTPTSIYLANRGYKVANVPIVVGTTFHEEIQKYPQLRVVGLTIDPEKLLRVRKVRCEQENIPNGSYLDESAIKEEIRQAYLFFLKIGCPIVDVTSRAVEETAAVILEELCLR
jgi:regulator of PEP synthase PpsR (kinase-PPPase family)